MVRLDLTWKLLRVTGLERRCWLTVTDTGAHPLLRNERSTNVVGLVSCAGRIMAAGRQAACTRY